MDDAERLIRDFCNDLLSTPFLIAPERANELNSEVFGGHPWIMRFEAVRANFHAYPQSKEIKASFAALLSLWATAQACMTISAEAAASMRAGKTTLDSSPNSAVANALALIDAAKGLIRDQSFAWPMELPVPDVEAPINTPYGAGNNLFLAGASWIILHEIAHVHLRHEETTSEYVIRQQEEEADRWAVSWIFEKLNEEEQRGLRILAVATALTWIGLIDSVRRGSTTHPHASERLGKCHALFGGEPEDPGYELASYIVKVIFNPSEELPDSETGNDALIDAMIAYTRNPR